MSTDKVDKDDQLSITDYSCTTNTEHAPYLTSLLFPSGYYAQWWIYRQLLEQKCSTDTKFGARSMQPEDH